MTPAEIYTAKKSRQLKEQGHTQTCVIYGKQPKQAWLDRRLA